MRPSRRGQTSSAVALSGSATGEERLDVGSADPGFVLGHPKFLIHVTVSPILGRVIDSPLSPPLARWDGLHLVLDLGLVERHLNELISAREDLRDLCLEGEGDGLAAEVTVVWRGVPARVGLEVAEIRLRHRHIGFRMRKLRALGGIPVPRTAVELALKSLDSPLLSVFSGHGIVVIDLRRWLPEELMLEVLTVQGTSRSLHVWFGSGSLATLPRRGPQLLPANTESD